MQDVKQGLSLLQGVSSAAIATDLASIVLPRLVTVRQRAHLSEEGVPEDQWNTRWFTLSRDGGPLYVLYRVNARSYAILREIVLPNGVWASLEAMQPSDDGEYVPIVQEAPHISIYCEGVGPEHPHSFRFRMGGLDDARAYDRFAERWFDDGYTLFKRTERYPPRIFDVDLTEPRLEALLFQMFPSDPPERLPNVRAMLALLEDINVIHEVRARLFEYCTHAGIPIVNV